MHNPTIFLDIDGTILEYMGSLHNVMVKTQGVLPGVIDKLNSWEEQGYKVILTTGRKESQRRFTENQLESLGIFYDMLIMGIGGGARYIINDRKPDGKDTAFAVNVERNAGLVDLPILDLLKDEYTIIRKTS